MLLNEQEEQNIKRLKKGIAAAGSEGL